MYVRQQDSSGVTLYYTDEVRQYDSAAVSVGVKVNQWHIVPPKQKNWMSVGYCTHQCSEVISLQRPCERGYLVPYPKPIRMW